MKIFNFVPLVDYEKLEHHWTEAEATATRRLGLLRDANKEFVRYGICPKCLPKLKEGKVNEWVHADGCELAEELGDKNEQI